MLVLSGTSLLVAPLLMPEGYSWVSHTTSESAAQCINSAWLARLGFLLFGLAVIWLAAINNLTWARGAVWLHKSFGVFMTATAAFSHKPWVADAAFDSVEDVLHSFTATAMGFSFVFAVLLRLVQREKQEHVGRILDIIAIIAATGIPILMFYQPMLDGLFQRFMFLIAYIWYGKEALLTGTQAK